MPYACYKRPRTMNSRVYTIVSAALLLVPALAVDEPGEDIVPAEPETEISPAAEAALEAAWEKLDQLVQLLESVEDAGSAAALAPQVGALYTELRQEDASVFADEDMELVAAEFDEIIRRLDEELVRLADAACYGCAELAEYCGLAELMSETLSAAEVKPAPVEEVESPAPEAGTESPLR